MTEPLPEDRRRAAFAALVAGQDGGQSVLASRQAVTREFGISPGQLLEIEREGIDAQWPPLGA